MIPFFSKKYISELSKRYLLLALFSLPSIGLVSYAQEISFSGAKLPVLEVSPEKNTGLDNIYVVYDVSGVSISFSSSNPAAVKWYKYSNLGGGFAEEVRDVTVDSSSSSLTVFEGDMGYIIKEGDRRYYIWIVNYLPHRFQVRSIEAAPERDCDFSRLRVDADGGPIHYFTINGQQRVLSRELRLDYETEEWNDASSDFNKVAKTKILESVGNELMVSPPAYCSTYFTLGGDRFMDQWNWHQQAESTVVVPTAVEVHTTAVQQGLEDDEDGPGSNMISSGNTGLGGSAPAEIDFNAYVSEGVVHHEWQMSRDPEFSNVEYRFNQQNLNYIFNSEGTYYLRYIGSNNDGSCEAVSETYTVSIGTSELKCPNAFSPNDDGINDEWKVSYRSIIKFDCWIFDRHGHQIIHLNSPDQGWDGKRGGKTVGPGVYYYVIKADGADGKHYKLTGDINIVRHKTIRSNTVNE